MDKQRIYCEQLDAWYQRPIGQALCRQLDPILESYLSQSFGYNLLQIGLPHQVEWLKNSPISHHYILAPSEFGDRVNIVSEIDLLPFDSESIDCVILPHTLEIVDDPARFFAEIDRVLVPEGHVIMIGINPYSAWGLRRYLPSGARLAPWNGNLQSLYQLQRLLTQTSYKIESIHHCFYALPIDDVGIQHRMRVMESIGRMVMSFPAGVYVIRAQKQVSKMTPIKPIWHFRNYVIGKQVVTANGS